MHITRFLFNQSFGVIGSYLLYKNSDLSIRESITETSLELTTLKIQ